ncbi:MAG: Antitoxin Phd YefM, type toxin-antitoxin system, partial [Thermomicrobiales bacterium]|nr:Antitoxin Phd YefM, type toxin-antitoxin system [Thermomicrobiales bacterium]
MSGESGTWAVAEAKARLSEVIARAAEDGPQAITRNGRRVAVVVS